ncbi:hypothetical protein [Sphaerisporangium corydalis]|uniref:MFS transporter n=1 Tax=Sphaerisporangium corydalis TaxID=1441875 RepID=A0ABV9EPF8_9ACTN|nr:hypothetical protein [Sphaerisporangium corydalis]
MVFAVVCVVVSAGGHAFAGGRAVPLAVMAVGAAGVLAMAYLLSDRERGPEGVLSATIIAQVILHQLFAWSAPVPTVYTEHGHHLGMVMVHVVVAVLTGWWLYRGERAVWLMLRLWAVGPLSALRRLLKAGECDLPAVRPAIPAAEPEIHLGRRITGAIHRRGPPVALAAG